jgi:hypothetical protein
MACIAFPAVRFFARHVVVAGHENMGNGSMEMEHKDYYLLVMVGDVEPHLSEPFQSEEERDKAAWDYRAEKDLEGRDGLFKLDVPKGAALFLAAYSAGFFEHEISD